MFTVTPERLVLVVLLLGTWSCARLPERPNGGRPEAVAVDVLPDSTSVPLAWGNLVAVSINPAFTNVMQFWFQDAHGNVRGVVYNLSKQQFERTAGLIARR